ncbi:amino acid adenylation domain-containing protein [Streptomyces sp. NBC_01012]|uniref:amino acid adenylation domain-containing protein n=1 Tax=Streptomyces sp. NBC_01012 TaxID=2903717 RepID=UPI003870D9F5|nr:amino acid adenylation domain-containing protein [Streptomyces sp. NBC_01012]
MTDAPYDGPSAPTLALTAAQRGLWFAQRMDARNPSYNVAEYADIQGRIDPVLLRASVRRVADEQEALRLTFGTRDGVPFQRVHESADVDVPLVDLSRYDDPRAEALRRMEECLSRPTDLATGPLVHMTLYRLAEEHHVFHQQVHHLALDGYGAALALARIAEVYTDSVAPAPPPAGQGPRPGPALGLLIDEEERYRSSGKHRADGAFWTDYLAGAPTPTGLTDERRSPGHGALRVRREFAAADAERLRAAARRAGTGWPTLFMTAMAVYLHRSRGLGEVVLGLPVTGRRTPVARATPGMLSNILPMRLRISPSDRVADVAKQASAQARKVLAHQRYPSESLRHDLGLAGTDIPLTGPSVNVLAFDDRLSFGPHRATLHNLSIGPVEDMALAVHASYADGGFHVDLLGNPGLYTPQELAAHHERLCRLIEAFADDEERTIGNLDVVGADDRQQVLGLGALTPVDPWAPRPATLPEQVAGLARTAPGDTAVVCGHTRLTFGELDAEVDVLARVLAARGAGPGARVAVGLPRSTDLVVAMVAVMRTGAAYLPLDPSYPTDRLAFMIEDSQPIALVATAETARAMDPRGTLPLVDPALAGLEPVVAEPAGPGLRDAAYVIYTSGSTGRPKGVVVEHRSLTNLLEHHRQETHALAERTLGRRLRVALTAATSFDASWDPVLWMVAGHELHIVDDEIRRDPEALVDFLVRQRIDAVETTPTYLRQMLTAGLLSDPRHRPLVIALGGETVDDALWNELAGQGGLLVFNFYGPTETTVDAVTTRITGGTPAIGRPVAGAGAYVLDPSLHPLPRGATGELYLSGEGVARGYSGRPGLTSERFLPDPFGPPGGRMYRTGDLARWSEKGTLEFLGRSDRQLKVRGYRVETGEVESALRSLPGVTEAAVAPAGSPDEVGRLAAYVVGDGIGDLTDVRDALAGLLPEHMVPTAWATVPRLPLTPNGKLDTDRLPQATPVAARGGAPRTPDEELMCSIFAECLGVPRTGRDDNFFLLGGHSLLATRLVSRIRGAFGVEMPIRVLFKSPTPAGLIAALDTAPTARPPVEAVSPRPERLPLSFGQQRLWLLDELGDTGAAYHLPVALRLSGPLAREALVDALADLTARHESLRTLFAVDEEGPYQRILTPEAARPTLVVMPEGSTSIEPDRAPFALGRELPLRAQLFPVGQYEHVLVLTLHHIAADGWSMGPLLHDLATAYTARVAGEMPRWDALPVQYADYALWQRDLLGDPRNGDSPAGRQLARWAQILEGLPEELTFPADRPRPARPSGRGGAVPVRLDADTHRALVRLAAGCGASTFMVLHAALSALMTRLGAGDDIAIGTPVAGRTDESLADLVGFFVNTLVLRADTSGAPSLRELVERVRSADLAAYTLQDIPFERVVEEIAPARSLSRHPLFQVMLSLNNTPAPRPSLPDLSVAHEASIGRTGAKFDLTWDLTEEHDDDGAPAGVGGEIEFSDDLFDRSTVERFAEHFTRLVRAALAAPDRPTADVGFLTPDQCDAALDELPRATRKPVAGSSVTREGTADEDRTVVDVLTTRAALQPARTAVVASDGRLSFGELLARSEQLACLLRDSGVGSGDRVAVALPRTSLHIVALFGVLRAGAVYVPVDPSHPRSRNQLILDTAAPRLLLTTAGTRDALSPTAASLLIDDPAVWRTAGGIPPRMPRAQDAAYVLHTSGSTGLPKGVVVEHRSLTNLFTSHRETLMEPAEARNNGLPLRVALTAAMTFDASWDPLLWMVAGHELHLVDDATRRDPEALTALVHHSAIDVVETTPSFLEQLRICGLFAPGQSRPRVLALGGEAVDESLWQELSTLRGVAVWNLYGPTETTVDSVMGRITTGTRPHLGHSVAATRARVLDERLRPIAPGGTGELYLSGAGLARGYENRPSATAARFLPDPYGVPGTRMYRTGDLVRRRKGRLEYVGRADGQVKVRGFRIETGEIATVLTAHPDVAHAAVTVRTDAGGEGRLVSWVVACDGQELSARALRAYLADRLPAYMVPTAVVPMAELPLTAHGKVDFTALSTAGDASRGAIDTDPPRSAQEEILCALFAESLGQEQVGRGDDFFELGGHSLLATRLIGRIRSAFGVELPVRTLFESTTPVALAERLDEAGTARPALRKAPRPARTPLSPAQQRLWFLHQLDPEAAAYHISVAVRLSGTLDRTALHRALADVTARHESLRTLVEVSGGEPFQAVLAAGDARPGMPVTTLDDPALAHALREASGRPFDLAQEMPLRAELFRLADDRHTLLITVHHIAADGWSMGPLAQDLAGAYAARTAGRSPSWTALPVQYRDYTLWQRGLLGSAADPASLSAAQLAYWTAEMSGAPEETPLPTDRPRPAVSGGSGGTVAFQVPADTTAGIGRLARTSATSTFMVLHTALAALLHRTGAGEDITIGTPVAGRTDEALEPLVGFFVNTLALRTGVHPETTFRELLARVRETDLAAYAHQELPFERLVEAVQPTRSLTRHPLFQVMLTLNNTRPPHLELPGLRARMDGVDTGGAKFDLSFGFTERPATTPGEHILDGTLEFSRDLFDTGTAHRITRWFLRLLDRAVSEPGTKVADLALTDEAEQRRLLLLGHGDAASTGPATVLDRFAETVAVSRSGDIAVTAPDGRISFSELDTRSGHIATLLTESGVHPGDVVAVLLPRSVDSIAALLGVLKAGGVYAPVDEFLPQARIDAVLDDARPRLVVTADATVGRVGDGRPRLVLDSAEPARHLAAPATPKPVVRPAPDSAAYLIHTSGSTGRPKGVLVGHGSLARLLDHHRRQVFAPAVRASGGRRLRVALTAALSFDASLDPVLWMVDGHQLHVLDDLTRRDSEAFVEAVRTRRLDVLESTPSHVRQLLDAGLLTPGSEHRPSVVVLGGEAVPQALWTALREVPEVRSWNFYGPTEATIDTLVTPLAEADRPVLGTPTTGTRAYLLDARLRPVPVGVVGDLYLAGDSLALGYHGRPADTARSFVPDPYGPTGARMYRTGDRARRGNDGALEFAGRADSQIKVRGFRVEPDEIVAVLEAHPDVVRAAVTADDGGPAGTRLTAYLVLTEAAGPAAVPAAIRAHTARHLPAYMVPTGWQLLDGIPLTPSGKLDRKALPDPAHATLAHSTDGTDRGRGPRNPREDVLCSLFAEVLGVEQVGEQVGIDDDFFALGGHSLLATRLIGRIRTALGVEVSIRSLFEAPNVAALAERLLDEADDNPLATLLPLRTTGDRPPLFCVHPAGGLAWSYGGLLPHLDPGQPVYGLQTPNLDGAAPFPDSMEAMAAVYVAELRSVQPHGPYHLFGWSFGGNLVQEVAVQLQEAGEHIALLTILDAFPIAPLDDLDSAGRDTVFRALLSNIGVGEEALEGDGEVEATAVRDAFRRSGSPLGSLEPATIDTMVDNFAGQARLMRAYTPRTFRGPVLFFTATEGRPQDTFGLELWAPYIDGHIENHDVACAHAQMMQPAARTQIGTTLAAALRAGHDTAQGDPA